MSTIEDIYINAILADAAYVEVTRLSNLSADLSPRMTPTLADFIGTNFSVLTSVTSPGTIGSGFDATVWKGKADTEYAGKLYISMRGTQQGTDFLNDVDLALGGPAGNQVVDMINWWFQITTPVGEQARQISAYAVEIGVDANGQPITQYQLGEAATIGGTGEVSAADLLSGRVEVNGHSLGGYLASAFTRLFGAQAHVTHTTTFNSAGFAPGSDAVFRQLERIVGIGYGMGAFAAAGDPSQTNAFAAHGLNVTTNSFWFNQVGQRIELFNEVGTGIPNHFMYKLTDSLALAAALERLDGSLTAARVNALFEVGSHDIAGSLEGTLDAVRRLLIGPGAPTTPTGDASGNAESRQAYHARIQDLLAHEQFTALQGNVRLEMVGEGIATQARSNFSAFAALQALTPFTLVGTGASAGALDSLWNSSAWSGTHAAWLADGSLSQGHREAGLATYSDKYLADRAAMLSKLIELYQKNLDPLLAHTSSHQGRTVLFLDGDQELRVAAGGLPSAAGGYDIVAFGKSGNDAAGELSGAAGNDRLYGLGGNDVLLGYEGNDRLEGGAGDDTLTGGSGNDSVLGGGGNDALDGGAGNDLLLGGQGIDTYTFTPGGGADVIDDSDGQGFIVVQGIGPIDGSGTIRLADGVWQTPNRLINYSLVPMEGGRSDLFVSFSDRNDVIRIQNWSTERNHGITLPANVTPPPATSAIIGDFIKQNNGTGYSTSVTGYVSAGAQPDADDVLLGTAEDDEMRGLGGNDALAGRDGADLIDGGAGNDLLFGGVGADTIRGGTGADFIYGSAVGAINRPTSVGFSPPVALSAVEVARGFSWVISRDGTPRWPDGDIVTLRMPSVNGAVPTSVFIGPDGLPYVESTGNLIDAGSGDDYVAAGTGDDTVRGGDDDDDILGLRGNDLLIGDAGSDIIFGDGTGDIGSAEYTAGEFHGEDVLVGSAGNDVLVGQGGSDVLYGGTEDDMLWGDDTNLEDTPLVNHGNDHLEGGDGNDRLSGGGRDDTLIGGAGADRLWGDGSTSELVDTAFHGADELRGEAGNDELHGGGGNDTLSGGADNDQLWGDDDSADTLAAGVHGNDLLDGGEGLDYLEGGGGDDVLLGGAGDDEIYGDGDPDRALSIVGDDALDGGAGNDLLYGGGAADTLLGGTGNDTLHGDFGDDDVGAAAGNDVLDGGDGDDVLTGDGGSDSLHGGTGADTMFGDSPDGVVELDSDGADSISGGDGADVLFGQRGNDTLSGGTGGDSLVGGSGDDLLQADDGDDTLFGMDDDDSLRGGAGTDYLDGGAGADLLNGGAGDDALYGQAGNDSLLGADGNDYVSGGDGDDVVEGGAGHDNLLGGAGNDTLIGGAGTDVMNGGAGDDVYVVSLGDMTIVNGMADSIQDTQGSNTLFLGATANELQLQTNGSGVLQLNAGPGRALLIQGATEGSISSIQLSDGSILAMDRLVGENYTAEVIGGSSSNYASLFGGLMSDLLSLHGAAASGVLSGGRGNDTINLNSTQGGTMLYSIGDGHDSIGSSTPQRTGLNVLRFGSGISAADLRLSNDWEVMRIHVGADPNDVITLLGFHTFTGGRAPIDRIDFADGSSMTYLQLVSLGISGGAGDDAVIGTTNADRLSGGAGRDTLEGYGGWDTLVGGPGDDFLYGGFGRDTYVLSPGDGFDVIVESGTSTTEIDTVSVVGASPDDLLVRGDGISLYLLLEGGTTQLSVARHFIAGEDSRIERIQFEDGTVWDATEISARTVIVAADTLIGTSGDDFYTVDNVRDHIVEESNGGYDSVTSTVNYTLPVNVEELVLQGPAASRAEGNSQSNRLVGSSFDNVFNRDSHIFGNGFDTLIGGDGNDLYFVNGGTHYQIIDSDDVVIEAPDGGTDVMVSTTFRTTLQDNVEVLVDRYSGGTWRQGNVIFPRMLRGTAADDIIVISAGNNPGSATSDLSDLISLASRHTSVMNNGGQIVIDGGAGADTMIGSADDTTYVVDHIGDVVIEAGGSLSIDTVRSSIDYVIGADIERLELTGSIAIAGTGNAADNWLSGDDNPTANLLRGGEGNDTYELGSGDSAIELVGEGFDTVFVRAGEAGFTYQLGHYANIESLGLDFFTSVGAAPVTLLGTDNDDVLVNRTRSSSYTDEYGFYHAGYGGLTLGGGGNDALEGGVGRDTLNGGTGADTMRGGIESDVYLVDDVNDVVFESSRINWYDPDPGNDDTVETAVDYALPFNVERLVAVGGNALTLTNGSSASATLDGSRNAAADTLIGGLGNSFYVVDGSDIVIEEEDGGWDSIQATTSFTLAENVESGSLQEDVVGGIIGNATANELSGNSRDNTLRGMGGNDALYGYDGDDLLEGGDGNDTLQGGDGNNTLIGGAGDDTYYATPGLRGFIDNRDADDSTDRLIVDIASSDAILSRQGNDLSVRAAGLADRLVLVGYFDTGIDSQGQQIDGRLDVLEFWSDGVVWDRSQIEAAITVNSAPVLSAALPDQVAAQGAVFSYQIPSTAFTDPDHGDSLVFSTSLASGAPLPSWLTFDPVGRRFSGTPHALGPIEVRVTASDFEGMSVSDILTISVSVVNLTITGSSGADTLVGGTGNDSLSGSGGNDRLVGGDGNDTLDGGSGNDTMEGGSGDDRYVVNASTDVVIETSSAGTDLITSSVTITSLAANIENATLSGSSGLSITGNALSNRLTGNSGANTLTGGEGNDTLDGGSGSDTLIGGAGDDVYFVNVTSDVITEAAGSGIDTVNSSVTLSSLAANVENATLTGTSGLSLTGNSLSNLLMGNSGANTLTGGGGHDTLDGGLGNDTMVGGAGNDTYYVNVSGDVVTEASSAGTDTVNSLVTWTLGSHLENLTLGGTAGINGTGNTLNNVLTGNSGGNALAGGAGDDTYVGGQGNDSLVDNSTTSADIYRWGIGQGNDTISDSGGTDRIEVLPGVTESEVTLTRSGDNLLLGITGASDVLTVLNWYTSSANRIEEIRLSDGTVIGEGSAPQSSSGGQLSSLSVDRSEAEQSTAFDTANHSTPLRLLMSRSNLLVEAMAQFAPSTGVSTGSGFGRPVDTMPALMASAM